MQALIKQLQEKEQTSATERASLVKKLEAAQAKQAAAERRANELKAHRPSLREETGVILDSLHTSEAIVQASLTKHGVSLVDLYTRVLKLEEECEQARKDKEEAELYQKCDWLIYRYLEHVLQDIETKTPQIAKQQQEYQEMVAGQQRLAKLYASVST